MHVNTPIRQAGLVGISEIEMYFDSHVGNLYNSIFEVTNDLWRQIAIDRGQQILNLSDFSSSQYM